LRRDNVIEEKDKDDIFDGYMDEETIEMISEEFPVLTEDEKDRIFASIERKLNIKSEKTFLTSDSVEGVEKYNRSQIVRFAGLAAAFTLIVAGLGGGSYLLHNLNKNAPPGPEPEITTQAVTGTSRSTTTIAFTYTTATAKTSILSVQTTTGTAASSSVTTSAVTVTTETTPEQTETPEAEVQDNITLTTAPEETETPAPTQPPPADPEPTQSPIDPNTPPTKEEADELLQAYLTSFDISRCRIAGTSSDLVLKHSYNDGSHYIGEEHFSKIDPSLYSGMDDLKNTFYSIMVRNNRTETMFGPEINCADSLDDHIFDQSEVDHSYITFNGELYGKTQQISSPGFGPYGSLPALIKAGKNGAFTITKLLDGRDKITNATSVILTVVRDQDTGRWLIDDFEYKYN
jgi:hypothetical protein